MASQVDQVTGNFSVVVNNPNTAQMANSYASLSLAGTFVGTVQVSARPAGVAGAAFVPLVASYPSGSTSSLTAPGVFTFQNLAGDWEYQIGCTAYTSGTINYSLQVAPATP